MASTIARGNSIDWADPRKAAQRVAGSSSESRSGHISVAPRDVAGVTDERNAHTYLARGLLRVPGLPSEGRAVAITQAEGRCLGALPQDLELRCRSRREPVLDEPLKR